MKTSFLKLIALTTALLPGLCGAAEEKSAASTAPVDYVLQQSDLIRVQVYQEPELLREIRISQELTINLPLIGSVDVRDKSVRQTEELLRQLYDRDFLVNPQITITVLEYAQRTVQVLGQVNNSGAIAFPPEQKMGLLEAISRAGGFTRLAERRKIQLTRTDEKGKTETFTINTDDLIKGNSGDQWLLKKGDVVFVPERIL
jgi:polysaccharide export outer membrane protein